MGRPSNSFKKLSGVEVRYDRVPSAPYGSRGIAYTFYSTVNFEAKLDACFKQLWQMSNLGVAEVITSAGAWVDKPGFHGAGRAFDLDGIFWPDLTFITLYDGYQNRNRKLYHSVEAVLRMHFGQVLNYNYDADHRDHFHIDDVAFRGFQTGSRTSVYFLQNALTYILGRPVARDGVYGQQTKRELRLAMNDMGLSGEITTASVYKQFLANVARIGFAGFADGVRPSAITPLTARTETEEEDPLNAYLEEEVPHADLEEDNEEFLPEIDSDLPSPDRLLRYVYEVIEEELGGTVLKKRVESAFTAFVQHPELQEWISSNSKTDASRPQADHHEMRQQEY